MSLSTTPIFDYLFYQVNRNASIDRETVDISIRRRTVMNKIFQLLKILIDKMFIIAEKFIISPDKITKELVESSKFKEHCDEPENCEHCKKRVTILHTIHAFAFFIIGIIINYAPQYIGIQENWIINTGNTSGWVSLVFFIVGIYELYGTYPRIFTYLNMYFLFISTGSVIFYIGALDLSAKYEPMKENFRLMSFGMLIITIMSIMMISPRLMDWWEENKKNVKSSLKLKKISGFILGALAIGTALFQFIQVLLSLFHH